EPRVVRLVFSCALVIVPARAAEAQVQTLTLGRGGNVAQILPHSGPGLGQHIAPASVNLPLSPGGSWQAMSVPPGLYLRAISMATPLIGYACGELGAVLKTTDGG